jgi:choline dehydrogenase-like flavoprotein
MAIIDARTLPNGSPIEADLVIIGGGLAGITLAKQLAGGPLKVAILEGGGLDIDMENQALYSGSGVQKAPGNPDRPLNDYPVQSRIRALGGSGHVWGGKCAPLDPADFAERPWIPHSGWPVTREQMQSYYDRACDLLEIPRFPLNRPASTEPNLQPLALDPPTASSRPRASSRSSRAARTRPRSTASVRSSPRPPTSRSISTPTS